MLSSLHCKIYTSEDVILKIQEHSGIGDGDSAALHWLLSLPSVGALEKYRK